MAKDIVIQDEYFKTVHMSGVTRLRTDLEGGGECYWVPEDEELGLISKTVSANGTYLAMNDSANGYSAVTVNVQNDFTELDNGKVIQNGSLVRQTRRTVTENGSYDTTTNNSISVEVSSNLAIKNLTANGIYRASDDNVDGYSDVMVNVQNTYTQADEGKVVDNSALVSQTSRTITENGVYDTTTNNSVTVETSSDLSSKTVIANGVYRASDDNLDGYSDVTVNVSNTYTQDDEGKVVNNSALVDQTERTITVNGTYDTTTNNSVTVDILAGLLTKIITENGTYQAFDDDADGYSDVIVTVPNTYTQADEGKVVDNSALVSQTSRTITVNGVYDTTTNNSVEVEVRGGVLSTKTITVNGIYQASDDDVDGYSSVTVSVTNPYSQADEGKVVSNSTLVSQTSRTITVNGTYDTTANNSVTVRTPSNLSAVRITENGTYYPSDYGVDGFSELSVKIPNTYAYEDYGKVVYSRTGLASQTELLITSNGEYDTTYNNSVTVSVWNAVVDRLDAYSNAYLYNASDYGLEGFDRVFVSIPLTEDPIVLSENGTYYASGYSVYGFTSVTVDVRPSLISYTISENGTYTPSDYGYYNCDGFSQITVAVQPNLTEYTVSENGTYNVSDYASEYDGFSQVTVDVQPNLTDETFNESGTYSATDYGYDGFSTVTIDVQPNVTYSEFWENGTYRASDYGYDGFSEIDIIVPTANTSIIDRTIYSFHNNEVERVGMYAFAGCTNLSILSLPYCYVIESFAFYDCNYLESIYLTNPYQCVTLYEDPFSRSSVPTIYVDPGLLTEYKNDPYWGIYSDYIEAYEE